MSARCGKIPRRAVHGVLLLDKPSGMGSTTAVARAKRAFQALKAGHTGTLDPMASGLLPICFGEATKFAADLLDADKSYEATLQLGVTTTTGDAEGEVLETKPVQVDADMLENVLSQFRGAIEQIPPMYSALKRDGRPLYEYARAGVTLEREARSVMIYRLDLISIDDAESASRVSIAVDCSKGTYIRTLAEDIGTALGCGAHLTALRRTRVGSLDIKNAVTLDMLESTDPTQREALLQPVDALIASLPRVDLDVTMTTRFRQGQRLSLWQRQPAVESRGLVRVYGLNDEGQNLLLGTAEMRDDLVLAPTRLILMSA